MLNWSPIETAPKDKVLLVMDSDRVRIIQAYCQTDFGPCWTGAETHLPLDFEPHYWINQGLLRDLPIAPSPEQRILDWCVAKEAQKNRPYGLLICRSTITFKDKATWNAQLVSWYRLTPQVPKDWHLEGKQMVYGQESVDEALNALALQEGI